MFFEVARRVMEEHPRVSGHPRGLVVLPIAGAGDGGLGDRVISAAETVLHHAYAFAETTGHDVAIVEPHRDKYAALQELRSRRTTAWQALPTAMRSFADDVAGAARQRTLAIYAGAGLSMSAGVPGWIRLLEEIAFANGGEEMLTRLRSFADVMDQAQLLSSFLGEDLLRRNVADYVSKSCRWWPWGLQRFALSHALLANLEADVTVTTNYDHLLEDAYEAAPRVLDVRAPDPMRGPGIRRLLSDHPGSHTRWLIKLHGDVADATSIVLTPEAYETAAFRAHALYGAVEGLLLTKRLLVVGSSMVDPPLRRVALAVRRCRGEGDHSKGFALLAGKQQSKMRALWDDLFDVQSVEEDYRLSALVLDRAGAEAVAADHFLDHRFESAGDDGKISDIRARLRELGLAIDESTVDGHPAVRDVRRLLRELGYKGQQYSKTGWLQAARSNGSRRRGEPRAR